MSRVRQPRTRAAAVRIADDRLARELAGWVGAMAFTLAVLAIPWIVGYVALAMGVTS